MSAAGWGGLGHFGRIFICANGISRMRECQVAATQPCGESHSLRMMLDTLDAPAQGVREDRHVGIQISVPPIQGITGDWPRRLDMSRYILPVPAAPRQTCGGCDASPCDSHTALQSRPETASSGQNDQRRSLHGP
jgi:hypothetical protein